MRFSGLLAKVREGSRGFERVRERSRGFELLRPAGEGSRGFEKFISNLFEKVQEGSRGFETQAIEEINVRASIQRWAIQT